MVVETSTFQKIVLMSRGKSGLVYEANSQQQTSVIQSDEVQVAVRYSGVNFADIIMRLGLYPDAPKFPFIPGYEWSGVVSDIGSSVTHVKVGDAVYGGSFFGGYSSRIRLPSWQVLKKPTHLSLEESAAIPVAFITMHTALIAMAGLRTGQKLLIDCATGGVGTIALQMARFLGVQAVGLTSSPSKLALIESFGAKAMTHSDFDRDVGCNNFDVIVNSAGGTSIGRHFARLKPTGRMVCLGMSSGMTYGATRIFSILAALVQTKKFNPVDLMNSNKGIMGVNALKIMQDEALARACLSNFSQIETMELRPMIGSVFAANQVNEAFALIESKKSQGKVILRW